MQLVAYGAQDIYLTGNPQITFFKVVYRRHTNFAMETIEQTLSGTSTLTTSSTKATCTISRNGDLVGTCWVTSSTASIEDGDSIIDSVDLEIGGQLIDRHYKEWMQIWAELTTISSKAEAYKCMTGSLTHGLNSTGTAGPAMLQIPLMFFFNDNPGLYLPLIALQYHEVKLIFTWGTSTAVGAAAALRFWCDYIYLDTDERRRFAQVSHEYLIEQVQRYSGTDATSHDLVFNHPVKELIWTSPATNAYATARLILNGHDRFANQEEEYFQLRQPFLYHTAVPNINMTMYDRHRWVSPIDTTITTHNATVADNAAKLEATQITFHATDFAAVPVKVGDILDINVGGLINDNGTDTNKYARAEINHHIVQIASVTGSAPAVCVFSTAIDAAHIFTLLQNADGLSVLIIGRLNDATASCSQLSSKINVYSFALKPEDHQPSGTCNFSRIDTAKLVFGTAPGGSFNCYATNYNVLRIMSGMGGLAYSN